jgi:hypothetical protein
MTLADFGADPSGARSSDDALRRALASLGGRPGVVGLGAGDYVFAEGGFSFGVGQGLVGPGRAVCALHYAGPPGRFLSFSAGRRFEALQNSSGAPQGGPVRGFSVHSRTENRVDAVVWSDLCAADMDIAVKGFRSPGSTGILFENVYGFCEGMNVRAGVQDCDTNVRFSSRRLAVLGAVAGSGHTSFTVPGHGLIDGSWVFVDGCAGLSPHRFGAPYAALAATVIDADTFTVAVPSTGSYRGGGSALLGRFSFDYSEYRFWLVAHPGQNGVVLENGNAMHGCELTIRGNFIGAGRTNAQIRADTGFAPAVLTIGNGARDELGDGNPLDCAYLTGSVHVNVECEGAPGDVGHSTVAFGGYEVPTGVIGEMLFLDGTVPFSDAQGLFLGANFSFMGLGDLHPIAHGAKYPLTLQNTKLAQKPGGVWTTGAPGRQILNVSIEGSGRFSHTFESGARLNVSFQNPSAEPLDAFEILLQQPASGPPATVIWPACVSWGRAGAPVLSVRPRATDWLQFVSLDTGRTWFGSVVAQDLGGE